MRARLLADADLRYGIVRGLRRREPTVDFQPSQRLIADGVEDPDVLALAAGLERVLVSHDFRTMPGHFYRFLEFRQSPGVILIPQMMPIGQAVEELQMAWACKEAEEFRNQITYLPL
ncbi:conserved hypothetical protein [Candidatus Sulfopaludibacter sp. SbA4]|nr:conserved hypothetical protein [Candidatus Sulfopaludibacter sp. SbA4]